MNPRNLRENRIYIIGVAVGLGVFVILVVKALSSTTYEGDSTLSKDASTAGQSTVKPNQGSSPNSSEVKSTSVGDLQSTLTLNSSTEHPDVKNVIQANNGGSSLNSTEKDEKSAPGMSPKKSEAPVPSGETTNASKNETQKIPFRGSGVIDTSTTERLPVTNNSSTPSTTIRDKNDTTTAIRLPVTDNSSTQSTTIRDKNDTTTTKRLSVTDNSSTPTANITDTKAASVSVLASKPEGHGKLIFTFLVLVALICGVTWFAFLRNGQVCRSKASFSENPRNLFESMNDTSPSSPSGYINMSSIKDEIQESSRIIRDFTPQQSKMYTY